MTGLIHLLRAPIGPDVDHGDVAVETPSSTRATASLSRASHSNAKMSAFAAMREA